MSVRAMTAVFDLDLQARLKWMLVCLADHARDDGTHIYPSVAGLAQKSSNDRRTVQRALRELEELGYIEPYEEPDNEYRTTAYRFPFMQRQYDAQVQDEREGVNPDEEGVTSAAHEGVNLDEERAVPVTPKPSQLQPSLKPSGTVSVSRRDLVFEALYALNTGTPYTSGVGARMTKAERKKLGDAASALREAGATPEQILASADAWAELFPGATWTPHACAGHWSKLVAIMERGYVSRGEPKRETAGDRMLRDLREASNA